MKLLGEWNWYLPAWLEWLPGVTPADADTETRPDVGRRTVAAD